ncbi:ABC transporter substrate-binding protein [Kribbella antibiotica]|nr:extracellular solute-binding protein [Kribbella antibiotica]
MKPNKLSWPAVGAALAMVTLVACSSSGGESSADGQVTLKWQGYSQERVGFYKEAAAEFKKEFPNITVVPEALAEDDYKQALPLSFRSKNSPDLFSYTWPTAGDYFELTDVLGNNWAAPLDASVLPADFKSRFRGTSDLMEPIYGKDGKIYTVPRPPSTGTIGYGYMYFNKDVLAKAGLTGNLPATWDQFTAACQAIKEKAGASCIAQSTQSPDEIERLLSTFVAVNVKGYTPSKVSTQSGKFTETSDPQFVAAIQYLRSLYEQKHVLPGQYDKIAARQAVAGGKAAFYFDGGWMSTVFPETFKFKNFGVALPPAKTTAAPDGYAGRIPQGPPLPELFISSQSKHPKEATQFLEWMTRPNGWYAQHFTEKGFDLLPWVAPDKAAQWLPKDNATRDLLPLDPKLHVLAPVPALKCPDLAKSQALTKVDQIQENLVHSTINKFLLSGGDWPSMARSVEDKQNKVFEAELGKEASAGLKVSTDCFAEPAWDGVTPFKYTK